MNLQSSIRCIERALERTPSCTVGLFGQKRVFGVQKGPSGGPEILAALCLDYDFFAFYYGHVLQHPKDSKKYLSVLISTKNFINAGDVDTLFSLFHYRTRECRDSQVFTVQNENDAYAETGSLESAVVALEYMISNFSIEKRHDYDDSPMEFRGLEICGFNFNDFEQDDVGERGLSSSDMESNER